MLNVILEISLTVVKIQKICSEELKPPQNRTAPKPRVLVPGRSVPASEKAKIQTRENASAFFALRLRTKS